MRNLEQSLSSDLMQSLWVQGATFEALLRAELRAQPAWAADLRRGIALVLRAHAAWQQRQAALQLAAAMADFAGTSWLVPPTVAPRCRLFRWLSSVLRHRCDALLLLLPLLRV